MSRTVLVAIDDDGILPQLIRQQFVKIRLACTALTTEEERARLSLCKKVGIINELFENTRVSL